MITENLSTLKINKLKSQEQYDKALAEGKINPNEIYFTPDEPLIKRVTLTDTTEVLLLEDSTVYDGESNPISILAIDYPAKKFICELIFTVGSEFKYYFPLGTRYVGKVPDFKEGETWELSIHNGIIASGKVVSE